MLDITYIRDNADTLRKAIADKQLNPDIVDQVLRVDEERRAVLGQVEIIRQNINTNVAEIKKSDNQKPTPAQIERGKSLKADLQNLEPQLKQIEETFKDLMSQVANPPAEDVPFGKDESGNQVVN